MMIGMKPVPIAENQTGDRMAEPSLAEKVRFLGCPENYPDSDVNEVIGQETHMSWVFMVGERVYKLKKPVRFAYLDFSTSERRAQMCRAENALNRRLAPDVYLGVVPLTLSPSRDLQINATGRIVDWLVVMKRLPEGQTLEDALKDKWLTPVWMDRIALKLKAFYHRALRVPIRPDVHIAGWKKAIALNGRVLRDERFKLPRGRIEQILSVQYRFVAQSANLLAQRARDGWIVDAHGDLRPEHIWLTNPVTIIDCLEFDGRLRAIDPLDEIAFLHLECERLGAKWAGDRLRRRLAHSLGDHPQNGLFLFYRSYRAMLRARLCIAHLLDPVPRNPQKWPRQARDYLDLAARDVAQLKLILKKQANRPAAGFHAGDLWRPRKGGLRARR